MGNGNLEVRIYPNPTSGKFTLNFDAAIFNIIAGIEVYNVYGEKVTRSVIPSRARNLTIDLSNQPSGIYFLHIKTNYGTINMEHPTWRKELILNK